MPAIALPPEPRRLTRRYRVLYSVTKDPYTVMHSNSVFFFDRAGNARLAGTVIAIASFFAAASCSLQPFSMFGAPAPAEIRAQYPSLSRSGNCGVEACDAAI